MVNIEIDGISFKVSNNTTVLQACTQVGIDLPRFCFHERLLIAGNCRMCLVEIEKSPKPVTGCTFPVMEGIKIFTNTPTVQKAREAVMEFLLLNHPLDCPICDQGGQCDLQDQSFFYSSDSGRFYNEKRSVEDKIGGPLIKTIMTRCIHCTRCIRFAHEIAGVTTLGTTGRGKKTEIGSYIKSILQSELSGNVIDLCPVSNFTKKINFQLLGALTAKPSAFQGRLWELEQVESIDVLDSVGSNVALNLKGNEIINITPCFNNSINEEWISDKTRFYYDSLNIQRLVFPKYKTVNNTFETKSWKDVFKFIKLSTKAANNKIGIVSSKFTSLETLLIAKTFLNLNGSSLLFNDELITKSQYNLNLPFNYKFNTTLKLLEYTDFCYLIEANPKKEASALQIRLRKNVYNGRMKVYYTGPFQNLGYESKSLGLNLNNNYQFLEGSNLAVKNLQKAKTPIIIFGNNEVSKNTNATYSILKRNLNSLYTKDYNAINHLTTNMGLINACELGLQSINLKKLQQLHTVFLLNTDKVNLNLLNKKTKVIYIGSHGTNDINNINLFLPSLTTTESENHFLNINSFLQKTKKAHAGKKESRQDWKIFTALLQYLNYDVKITNQKTLMKTFENNYKFLLTKKYVKETILINSNLETNYKNNYVSKPNIRDFYVTDILTKNSRIMNKTSLSTTKINFN